MLDPCEKPTVENYHSDLSFLFITHIGKASPRPTHIVTLAYSIRQLGLHEA